MVTGPIGEHLQAGTEDAPVLDRPAPLRRLHDSVAGYKYPDLLTCFLKTLRRSRLSNNILHEIIFDIKSRLAATVPRHSLR